MCETHFIIEEKCAHFNAHYYGNAVYVFLGFSLFHSRSSVSNWDFLHCTTAGYWQITVSKFRSKLIYPYQYSVHNSLLHWLSNFQNAITPQHIAENYCNNALLTHFIFTMNLRNQGWNCRRLGEPPCSCLQTLIFEWKSALNFNSWAKFQAFRHLTPPPIILG